MTETQKNAFRKNVKKLMIDKEITVTELAEKLDCSVSMLSHSINGTKKPPFDMVVALANFFRVKVDDLIQ